MERTIDEEVTSQAQPSHTPRLFLSFFCDDFNTVSL